MTKDIMTKAAATEKDPLVVQVDPSLGTSLVPAQQTTNGDTEATVAVVLPSLTAEAADIFKLAVPIFIARLSFVGMKTTDTALLGHVSREALSASALSDLWTMCSLVFVSGRILGVFIGSDVGAGNHKLAGIYLQVSLVVLGSMSLFVFVAWNLTGQVWLAFGGDPEISDMAGYYSRVLSFAIPGIVAFGQLSQFFSAQRIVHPEKNSAMLGLALNLILGLIFVLGWPIPGFQGYQFAACPVVTTVVTYIQLIIILYVYVWKRRLHEACWGGWKLDEITWKRVKTFSALYFPAAMGSASDFWRVAVIGAVAAKLGEEEVAVFNTSYRIMWIALIMVGALSGASAINMSLRLGKNQPDGAKQVGFVGVALATAILAVLSFLILVRSEWFGRIFTDDEIFLQLFSEAAIPFTLSLFFMNLAVAIEKIPFSMGRTREIFWMGFVASWGGQVPGVIFCTTYWRADLVGLYTGMAIGYAILVLLYGTITWRSDWNLYAEMAQTRSEVVAKKT